MPQYFEDKNTCLNTFGRSIKQLGVKYILQDGERTQIKQRIWYLSMYIIEAQIPERRRIIKRNLHKDKQLVVRVLI